MARQLRIEFPGALYHVLSRGNERNPIFKKDSDRALFIATLKDSAELAGVEVISYVLMDNHYHMIIETPNANLSRFMRHFGLTYTVRFNKKYGRSGHLFQGRYKAILIEEDPYLMVLSRYIHLNPVRTKEWEDKKAEEKWEYLKEYQWSTLPGCIEKKKRAAWIKYDKTMGYFANPQAYKEYMIEGLNTTLDSPFKEIKSQIILGSEGFVDKLKRYLKEKTKMREIPALRTLKKTLTIEDIIREVGDCFHIKKEALISKSGREMRQIAMEMAYRYTNNNQEDIGKVFGVDYSTVSQNRKRLKPKIEKDLKLSKAFKKIVERLDEMSN